MQFLMFCFCTRWNARSNSAPGERREIVTIGRRTGWSFWSIDEWWGFVFSPQWDSCRTYKSLNLCTNLIRWSFYHPRYTWQSTMPFIYGHWCSILYQANPANCGEYGLAPQKKGDHHHHSAMHSNLLLVNWKIVSPISAELFVWPKIMQTGLITDLSWLH